MGKRRGWLAAALVGALVLATAPIVKADDFYKGQTIRIIVGFSAGGGFDTYARAISRHMGKHIPGNPTIIVENMTGAGSMIAANYVYNRAKPDGLTIGHFHGGLIMQQVLGKKGVQFDGRKMEWIGVPVSDTPACALTTASGVTTTDQWFAAKKPVKIGTEAPGASTSDIPRVLKAALKLPIQLIEGYKGTADIRLAANSGEIDGGCWGYESIRSTWRKPLESGEVKVVIQLVPKKHPELQNVGNAIDYAKSKEARFLIEAGVQNPALVYRPYSLPPGVPADRVKTLRDAFMATMKDPEFMADAKRSKLDLDPKSGEEVEKIVKGFFKLRSKEVATLKKVLIPK